ncbi:MAG: hypothetical protein IKU55_04690 [Clostridia bacterium]|nr:hypothetical protein [Clostridia bacterium]
MERYRWRKPISMLMVVMLLVRLLGNVGVVRSAVSTGLQIAGGSLVPSLFVFSVVAQLIVRLQLLQPLEACLAPMFRKLFGLSAPCVSAWLLGALGGYPIGAQVLVSQVRQGSLDVREAESALGICNLCGAAFVVSVVAPILGLSVNGGFLLWGIHLVASLLTATVLRPFAPNGQISKTNTTPPPSDVAFASAFSDAVATAVKSMLALTGMICTFQVITAFVGQLCPTISTIFYGALEMTNGIFSLNNDELVLASALIGWGGCCVAAQVAAMTVTIKLRLRRYLIAKLLHAAIAAILTVLLQKFTS